MDYNHDFGLQHFPDLEISQLRNLTFNFFNLKIWTSIIINDTAAAAAAYTGGSTLVVLYLLRALLSFANLLLIKSLIS